MQFTSILTIKIYKTFIELIECIPKFNRYILIYLEIELSELRNGVIIKICKAFSRFSYESIKCLGAISS